MNIDTLTAFAGIIASVVGSYVALRKLSQSTNSKKTQKPLKVDISIFGYRLRLERNQS
jgi:hypothetical protein